MISVALAALTGGLLAAAWLWRGAERARRTASASLEQVTAERETLSMQLARETTARKKQAEELAALRKKNDKARRREAKAGKGGADRAVGTAARLADLEEQLARAERARDRGRREREQLAAEIARLEAQLATARERPAAPATPPPLVETPPVPNAARDEALAEVASLREQLAKANEALEQAKLTEARMRKRMSNQEQLYASVRAELDVKKDRLRAQEERIQRLEALQVAIRD